ncbi:MAG TPA: methyltransferase domain-containing protein [Acidimicrobiales bacterium]|nr:methyltransferase domain-containing protein [Acidimicrobiales bacterium]
MTTTLSYEDWARAFHGHAFLRRSAERNAGFLLPHLEPGQRVLDLGCGPGAITVGLAQRVGPGGAVVGVDRDPRWFDTARTVASGHPEVRFEEADAASLPFDDDAFDVAFLHALLQHVDSPEAVLAEVRRVVRPGGLVAVGDADLDGFLQHPRSEPIDASGELDRRQRRQPHVGRRLPELLRGAGFDHVEFTVLPNIACGAEAVAGVAAAAARRLEADAFADHAVAEGWVRDRSELAAMAAGWRAWSAAPGALLVTFWCQALAR